LKDKIESLELLLAQNGRSTFDRIISELGKDSNLDSQIFMLLAKLNDSRALFPLINYATKSKETEHTQRLLQYMAHTMDPRSEDFLYNYLGILTRPHRQIAEDAYQKCRDNHEFIYQFAGSDKLYNRALDSLGGILVTSENLTKFENAINENKNPSNKPQTYVITMNGKMLIGINLNEHVFVAKGQDVCAAGEIIFGKTSQGWRVNYVNNRSNGYFPHKSSFHWVRKYFDKSNIRFGKEDFDDVFPRQGFNDEDFLSVQKFGNFHS